VSDPNRYNIAANQAQRTLGGNILVVDPNGQLVAYEDYARLSAELTDLKSTADRFKAEVERLTVFVNENAHLHKGIYSLSLNVAQLKDEVERLRKAGDALALKYHTLCRDIYCDGWLRPFKTLSEFKVKQVEDWNAAKDGKPSK
jgi:predicted RNase H-like nuclease (RuvC/YqgF family)